MIITCIKCYKKFDLDSNLIPDNGRLIQCGSCDHKWFFKKEIINKNPDPIIFDNKENFQLLDDNLKLERNDEINDELNTDRKRFKNVKNLNLNKKKQKKIKILNWLIVFIISLAAIIIILDTFKSTLNIIVPNIEFLLYNLYETFRDITLFINDLF